MQMLTSTTSTLLHSFTIQENRHQPGIFKNTLIMNKKVPFLFNTAIKLNKIGYGGRVPPHVPKASPDAIEILRFALDDTLWNGA